MKNITKYLLVALISLSFVSAKAGELSVTGSAKASYSITSSDGTAGKVEQGKGLGVTNEFSLGASGETDFGTWAYAIDYDNANAFDDAKITLTTSMGTLGVFISEGGLETVNAASQSVMSRPSDTSYSEGMADNFNLGGSNTLQYHSPAGLLPLGTVFKVAYAPSNSSATQGSAAVSLNDYKATGSANTGAFIANTETAISQTAQMGTSASHYNISLTPVEGLTVGADYLDFDGVVGATAQQPESGAAYAKYSFGPATVGFSKGWVAYAIGASGTDVIESTENTKYSIAFNVNENFSVSYEHEESNPDNQTAATANNTMESTGIQAAYTVGGMTIAVAMNDHENAAYINNKDVTDTVISVAMAF